MLYTDVKDKRFTGEQEKNKNKNKQQNSSFHESLPALSA